MFVIDKCALTIDSSQHAWNLWQVRCPSLLFANCANCCICQLISQQSGTRSVRQSVTRFNCKQQRVLITMHRTCHLLIFDLSSASNPIDMRGMCARECVYEFVPYYYLFCCCCFFFLLLCATRVANEKLCVYFPISLQFLRQEYQKVVLLRAFQ